MDACILTVAGSDSIAGAGIQADIKTAQTLGLHAACAVTCVTAQNTTSFLDVQPIKASIIASQMRAAFQDLPVAAVKVGMVGNARNVLEIAQVLKEARQNNPRFPIVVDPVLGATTQTQRDDAAEAAKEETTRAISRYLVPLATVITPNQPEALALAKICGQILSGMTTAEGFIATPPNKATERTLASWAARIIIASGSDAVLVKGGHSANAQTLQDLLFTAQHSEPMTVQGKDGPDFTVNLELPSLDDYLRVPVSYSAPRLPGEFHGTGCTLSTALACGLALGKSLPDAVGFAHAYLQKCLQASDGAAGHGSTLINHSAGC